MRVRFEVSGGIGFFRALAIPRTIDVNTLTDSDRLSLMQLVDETQFFSLPTRISAPRGAAGYLTCQLTIEHGDRRHSVAVSDPVAIAPLQKLIDVVRSLASR